jgi:hypothetical protein
MLLRTDWGKSPARPLFAIAVQKTEHRGEREFVRMSRGIFDRVKRELRIRFAKRGAVAYHNHSNFYFFTYIWDTLRQRGAVQMSMSITSKGAI